MRRTCKRSNNRRTGGVLSDSEANVRESVSRSCYAYTAYRMNSRSREINSYKVELLRSPATAGQTNLMGIPDLQSDEFENGKKN